MTLLKSEVELIKQAKEAINLSRQPFTCAGSINAQDLDLASIKLYVENQPPLPEGGMNSAQASPAPTSTVRLYNLPLSDADVTDLYEQASISPFGYGAQTIVDKSYRSAREIKPGQFGLNTDFLSVGSVLPTLQARLELDQCLSAKMHKLSVYAKDDFFRPHRDTPRSNNHIGTIVLCLPSHFAGGELVVRHEGNELVHDWSTIDPNDAAKPIDQVQWAFLYSDCEHEVKPVTEGYRLTIQYDVYSIARGPATGKPGTAEPLVQALKSLAGKASVQTYGFALYHEYPTNGQFLQETALKGSDAVLYNTLAAMGWDFDIFAVYENDGELDDDDDEMVGQDTGVKDQVSLEVDALYRSKHWISTHCDVCRGLVTEDDSLVGALDRVGAGPRPDIVWILPPTHFDNEEAYVSYGNEHSIGYQYRTFALIVTVPEAK